MQSARARGSLPWQRISIRSWRHCIWKQDVLYTESDWMHLELARGVHLHLGNAISICICRTCSGHMQALRQAQLTILSVLYTCTSCDPIISEDRP